MEWAKINWNPRQETLPDFFLRFSLLVKRLAGVGAAETDNNIVIKLLALMPWDFRHVVDRLSHAPSSEQTLPLVNGHSNDDRALIAVGNPSSSNRNPAGRGGGNRGTGARGKGRGGGNNNNGAGNSKRRNGSCHYCGKDGHWKNECRKKASMRTPWVVNQTSRPVQILPMTMFTFLLL
ncbi:hypothetical protein AC1031_018346 [Aphanomyces cochlioides]|nr:hypothetical protein AC1031_018346 [Aphanomyces cochlioides]